MEHIIIHRVNDRYASFPSVARLSDGRLVCVFREAGPESARAAIMGVHTHQDIDSRIMISTGDTSGKSWSNAREVIRSGENAYSDPSIMICANGTWILRAACWRLVASKDRHMLKGPIHRHYVRTSQVGMLNGNEYFISRDQGSSWSATESQVEDTFWRHAVSREAPIELEDGSLLQAVYGGWPTTTECAAILRSFDEGRTWGDVTKLAGDPALGLLYRQHKNFNEVSLVSLDVETIIALVRADTSFTVDTGEHVTEGGMGRLHWARSDDAGMTWTKPEPTPVWGQPAHGLNLGNGRVLCTFGHRRTPFGIQAAICNVSESSFKVERKIVLRDDSAGWDCGYPCSVMLNDKSILSIYYIHGPDGIRHISATKWRIEEMEEIA